MAFVEFNDVRKVYKMGEVEVAAADGMTFPPKLASSWWWLPWPAPARPRF